MPTAPQQSGRSALMKNVAPCATIVLVPRAVGGLRSRICRRPGNYECFRLPRLPHSLAISLPSLSAASSRAEVQTAGHHYQWVLRSFVCPRAARACLNLLLPGEVPGEGAVTQCLLLPGIPLMLALMMADTGRRPAAASSVSTAPATAFNPHTPGKQASFDDTRPPGPRPA